MAIKVYTGSANVTENSTADVTIKSIAALASGFRQRISSIWIDGTNLTVDAILSIDYYMGAAGATKCNVDQYNMVIEAGKTVNLIPYGPIEIDTRLDVIINSIGTGAAGPVAVYYRIPYDDSIEKLQSVFNGTGDTDDVDVVMRQLYVNNDTATASARFNNSSTGYAASFVTSGAHAIYGYGGGAGSNGMRMTAQFASGVGFYGGTNGHGLYGVGGTATGDGGRFEGQGGGHGLTCSGVTIYHGLYCLSGAGATGDGIHSESMATNGRGFYILGKGTGHGFSMTKGAGVGAKDIDADEIDTIDTNVDALIVSVAALPTNSEMNQALQILGGQVQPTGANVTYLS